MPSVPPASDEGAVAAVATRRRFARLATIREVIRQRRLHTVVVRVVTVLFLIHYDPIGAELARLQTIDRNIESNFANLFPRPPTGKVAVVLISETDLASDYFRTDWPISYEKTAGIIRAIACAGAVGMFFDYGLSKRYVPDDEKEELATFIRDPSEAPLCDGERAPPKIPVYFGKIRGVSSPISDEITAGGHTFPIEVSAEDLIYPLAPRPGAPRPVDVHDRSPGFGILAASCEPTTLIPSLCRDGAGVPQGTSPLRIQWSPLLDRDQARVSGNVTAGVACRGPQGLADFVRQIGFGKVWENCPPLLTIFAQDLFRPSDFIATNGDPKLVLKDRFVFVGVNLAGIVDVVRSTVHDRLPGVYRHAMALDNLIATPVNYPSRPSRRLFILLTIGFVLVAEVVRELERRNHVGRWPSFLILLVLVLAAVVGTRVAAWPLSMLVPVFGYYLGFETLSGLMKRSRS